MKKWLIRIVLLICLLLGGILFIEIYGSSLFQEENPIFEKGTVLRVIDGDTISVSLNGQETKVRMIGVDTPETETEIGKIAASYTKKYLSEGKTIYLEYDEGKQDKYGRTLAYIWLKEDVDTHSFSDFKEYNFGAILLQNTYCRALYYAPNEKYRNWYEQLDSHNYFGE